ncbi:interferon-induced very large GTPase 1-like [Acipenser ruthenus]|uniref:interferon-induced very large GTPase 1-like n=1 Tax=Acipenser ruthenus TaxID=7906 RepID=UPI0027425A5A|nr:interferon-induced very large GTPase 1-like [Acipenser ruthenus]
MGVLVHAVCGALILLLSEGCSPLSGSEEPLSAVYHGDVVLNCSFTLSGGQKDLCLKWLKERDGQIETVLSYCGGRVQKNEASAIYRDRAYLYPDELIWGSAPLWLHGIEISDQGKYTCYVEDRKFGDSEQMTVTVEVEGENQRETQSILPFVIGVAVLLVIALIGVLGVLKPVNLQIGTSEVSSESITAGQRTQETELQVDMKKSQDSNITHSTQEPLFTEDTEDMSSSERTQETELQVDMKKSQDSHITHSTQEPLFTEDTEDMSSSERTQETELQVDMKKTQDSHITHSTQEPLFTEDTEDMSTSERTQEIELQVEMKKTQDSHITHSTQEPLFTEDTEDMSSSERTQETELQVDMKKTQDSHIIHSTQEPLFTEDTEDMSSSERTQETELQVDMKKTQDSHITHSTQEPLFTEDTEDMSSSERTQETELQVEMKKTQDSHITHSTQEPLFTEDTEDMSTSERTQEIELQVEMKKTQDSHITHSTQEPLFTEDTEDMSSSERTQETELQVEMKKTQDSHITHSTQEPLFTKDTEDMSSSERTQETELQVDMKKTQDSHITHSTQEPLFTEDTEDMSSSERTQETELQVDMKKIQDSHITHSTQETVFTKDTEDMSSSERTVDTVPIIPDLQNLPEGPEDTSLQVISSPPLIAEASTLVTTVSVHDIAKITEDVPSTPPAAVAPPEQIKISSVKTNSVSLSWGKPAGMAKVPHCFKITYCSSDHQGNITAKSNSTVVTKLKSGREYVFRVTTVLKNGTQSTFVSTSACTNPSPPGNLRIDSVEIDSVSLSWDSPVGMKEIPHRFKIIYNSYDKRHQESITAASNSTVISKLRPGTDYKFRVCTELANRTLSTPVTTSVCTRPSPPGEVRIDSVEFDSVSLSWDRPAGLAEIPHSFNITYSSSDKKHRDSITTKSNSTIIPKLKPARDYLLRVSTVLVNSTQSNTVSTSICTKPAPPGKIKIDSVGLDSVSLSWGSPAGMNGIPHSFIITYSSSDEGGRGSSTAPSNSTVITELKPGREYVFRVTTALENGIQSMSVSTTGCTKTHQEDFLCKLGLEKYLTRKLALSTVLEIGTENITDKPIKSLSQLPWCFLKSLMMVNVTARSTKCCVAETKTDTTLQDLDSYLQLLSSNDAQDSNTHAINPLDLITALFLCSDSFLQQEIMLKMSMCQFAVPLLLPDCNTNQCTLMLWAMRDIVKKFRPRSLVDSKGFIEESIIRTAMPMISFVRLGDCSLSKSQILNKLLSNPQQYHDFFTHCDMKCGDVPKQISNGLVEIGWYLPCGKTNLDIFPEPVAVANLRGDISSFQAQFSILGLISSAVFIFFDSITESECKFLTSVKNIKAQVFLVVNSQSKTFQNVTPLKNLASKLKLNGDHILLKNKQINDADFVTKLQLTMNDIMKNSPQKMTIEGMSDVVHELGIPVDEACTACQNAKKRAEEITSQINDVVQYKEDQLPLQGNLWKELAKIEKEECRLRRAGDQSIEKYKTKLQKEKQKLRQQQISCNISESMQCFIAAISNESKEERTYFLKWMRMNLDVTARKKLSGLRDEYKEKCCKFSENKEIIADLDRQISNSSLGLEHFMREMGQLYEAACSLPVKEESRQQFQHLPSLGADLLLDGFPLELVDGDASNIPVRWVTDVLTELHRKVQHKSRVLVVTVLGVQSTGKSTLLNTMFGVQFAVSSGRCTRGAFMLLIKVKQDLKKELKCDFILVIDTEGLKSPELAQLEDSYEHDNELATLVVGLSDTTIINIAMENSTEMKDILQIVVHAFLRMKEVGKKPKCHFVHQNVGDVSAHDKNARDRKMLLEQLNEMTQAAARMEKKDIDRKFTDIMEYDPEKNNLYIPGLWHGNPPMAPVNTGYSETVYEFKKSLIEDLKSCNDQKPPAQITEFLTWVESLWKAVKYENFIFSFRNSLVAEAYSNLCVAFNKWEWSFQKHMYNWLAKAETRISNTNNQHTNLDEFLRRLKAEATTELTLQEEKTLDKLTKYYENKDGHVNLVESYRTVFEKSIKSLRIDIENSLTNKCTAAIGLQKGMKKVRDINGKHKAILEERVLKLLGECRLSKRPLSDEQLKGEFEKMWKETVSALDFKGIDKRDIVLDVYIQLRKQLKRHGAAVKMVLNETSDLTKYGVTQFDITEKHFDREWYRTLTDCLYKTHHKEDANMMSQSLIAECRKFVTDKKGSKTDYHETYTRELLEMIDVKLKDIEKTKTNAQFEVDLKLHICGFAASEFQQMHMNFVKINNPKKHLEKSKPQYCSDFIDLYHEKDQCQKKAEEFTERCLEPAVREYVVKTLGIDIADEMLTGKHSVKYSTRSFFQYSILKQLLDEKNFENYVAYIINYEDFVKKWISECIVEQFSKDNALSDLEVKRLKSITKKIQAAIEKEKKVETHGIKTISMFIKNICSILNNDVVISTDELGLKLIPDKASTEEFIGHLQYYVEQMMNSLSAKFSQELNIEEKLISLPFNPQDELFKRVFGCGKLCPFCKVPCEAGGKAHSKHHASVHRPQGLGRYRKLTNNKLVENVCTSDVFSERRFRNADTEGKFHPYKDYHKFYPDWNIAPDTSIEASDYWKYVLTTFNEDFAEEYSAKPANVPEEWKNITYKQAMKSLNELFNVSS